MAMLKKEYHIPSKSGVADVYARCWYPENGVKAIFQIVHGMAEHGDRYEEMAEYLCDRGFAVLVDDHVGHGRSVKSDADLGYFGENGGWNAFVEDERTLTELIKAEYPDAPIVFFGHSMGSFIAREYIRRYGNDSRIAAAIFCGTSGKNPASAMAIHIAGTIAKAKGSKHKSKFIDKLAFGNYNAKIQKPETAFDWLSVDRENVKRYIADPLCGFLFTAAGYKDLFTILTKVSGKDWYAQMPDLPILIISGEDDPVGLYGKGVKQVYNDLKLAGKKDVTLKIYPGMRHEITNETDRAVVFEDICVWSLGKLK